MPPIDATSAQPDRQLALAHDALETVRRCPEHVPAWWRLIERTAPLPVAGLLAICELVRNVHAGTALAQWLQWSALWRLSGDARHLASMARVAVQLPDPDRWMALTFVVWHHALTRAHDKPAFRQLFLDTLQVELLGTLGRGLQRVAKTTNTPGLLSSLQRVAIVAPHLSTGAHAGTGLVFDLRAVLERNGVHTHVFAAQELSLPGMGGYFAGGDQSTVAPAQPSTWRLRTQQNAQVSLANADFSLANRWADLLQGVRHYEPDVVIFVGFCSPLVWALQSEYPVVGMSLHTVPPLAPVDVWLAANPETGLASFWPGLPAPRVAHFPYRFWPVQTTETASRDALGLPREAILLASSGYRLQAEMPREWMDQLLAVLDKHPLAHWLLIGIPEAQQQAILAHHPRLHCLPHQDDLAACLRMVDIYINPPRMGGGASVALAMNLGIPVQSMRDSDGGDKVGDMAASDTNVYMQQLAEWITDADLRERAGAALQRRFREELDLSQPESSQRLIKACHDAMACFGRRQAGHCAPARHNQ